MAYAGLLRPMVAALGHPTHAVRRALATHGEVLAGLSEADAAAVLDHSSGSVTRRFYAHGSQAEVVGAALVRWEGLVLKLMAEAAPAGQTWPAFLPRP